MLLDMHEKFLKPYNPAETEERIYKLWEESGYFNPDNLPSNSQALEARRFSMVLPPPNVTGNLHTGHAVMLAIEDALVRYKRMRGFKTLWIPGTDHAAIATQTRVEKELIKNEGKTRHDLGREEFLKRVEVFARQSRDQIVVQLKKMGASLDWSRQAYTLDEKRSLAVRAAFKQMYEAGLIYRGERIVNWDPRGQTVVSDEEIEYAEEKAPFYYFKYGPFAIATARPETKFGDKYVVMHPTDKRYKKYQQGEKLTVEWINGPIEATVIKDEAIDPEFGTGVMTITPSHSFIDFEIAERHKLAKEQVIDKYGKLLSIAGEFAEMKITEARPKIVEKLKKKGLLEKIDENYIHRLARADRSGGLIEPQIMKQWFVDVNKPIKERGNKTLKELMRQSVETDRIKILPERFEKIYFHWIDNLRDWCISRQIWFGHRIPVWYHAPVCIPKPGREKDIEKCKDIIVSGEKPICEFCDAEYSQDPDTLDTWFSSGLWTFSTLGWPEQTKDLKTYHPTDVLETGYDILFFWVARMILMSGFLLGDIPFRTVYLHGLVRDSQGRKMSKSLGNIVDPVDLIKKYGADALRMALVFGTALGNDMNLSEDKVKAHKLFANKLWNIARFVLSQGPTLKPPKGRTFESDLITEDRKLLAEFNALAKEITEDIENYRPHLATEKLYHYAWHRLADVILEESKPIISLSDSAAKSRQLLLRYILENLLKLLHPFMPFITEEIWSMMNKENLLMVEQWPIH